MKVNDRAGNQINLFEALCRLAEGFLFGQGALNLPSAIFEVGVRSTRPKVNPHGRF